MATNSWVLPVLALTVALTVSCSHSRIQPQDASTSTSTTTSTVATNTAGRAKITFDPCTQIPASVIAQQKLDRLPPKPDRSADGDIENNRCGYLAQARYGVSAVASNYTLEMDKKVDFHGDFKEFDINGRRALSFLIYKNDPTACAIDVEATTGTYGVNASSAKGTFGDFPDCLTAARAHLDAFLPYFPA
ncbi:DUF3558 domain-containing protein [Mycobacteroides abscessus subsp. abscessus]|nr:DUF3558 domain-containing protein [Mycobacteroides abscessus]MDO3169598.1 DUF3558 domain-containing protein [Mycobacteroides abscessus subsp. abscessus]RIT93151.1 DUF3558 domain-containing protein [Mycobacteroides abscessus]